MEGSDRDQDRQPPESGVQPLPPGEDRRQEGRDQSDRRNVVDRRVGLERRRGPGRRRSDDRRSAEEGEMTKEQFSFLMAVNEYKRVNKRPFPTWTEVLDVVKALGYRKVADPRDIV
ncbi:MAG TPA: hypothetical protein VM389_11865 [Phycisphaerae bacterium]|nr:hypothetical protein [Phycisphaerae bacterium]